MCAKIVPYAKIDLRLKYQVGLDLLKIDVRSI